MNNERFVKLKKTKLFKLGNENKYVLLSFLCSVFVLLIVFMCFGVFPFGNKTVLRMDLYHQYGPLFAELYDRLTSGSSLIYSWTSGGGGSFLGNFFNYLSSPLSVFILFFGHMNNPESIAFLMLIKSALASAFFCYYLKNSEDIKKHNISTVAFSVLYSFCGYFIAYYWNIMWLDAMVLLPLVLLGIEKIINKGKFGLYTCALALTIIANYYLGFMVCIFSVLYAVMYYFGKYEFTSTLTIFAEDTPKTRIKKLKNSRLFTSIGKFIGGSALALMLCAFTLLPIYFILQSSSATSGTFPTEVSSYFKIFDFMANHLASLEPTIRSSGEDVLPNIYCGIITIILTFVYLYTKSIPLREKISRISMIAILYISFNTNVINYMWHGLHFPNDLPYRFSFMYSFILLVMAYKALVRIREISRKDILNIGIALIAFIVLAEKLGSKNVLDETVIISIVFVVIYTIVLGMLHNKKFQTGAVATLLLCCVLTESVVANTNHYLIDQPKESYTKDYKSFRQLKSQLDDYDKTYFYRMELTNLNMRMDPCWFGYNGISTFSSMASEPLSNLQYNLGMYGNFINSYTYNLQTPVYNSMFSLKYIVNNSPNIKMNPELYTKLMKVGEYTAYKNNFDLPIAYCVDKELLYWNSSSDNPFENQNEYILNSTGVKNVLEELSLQDIQYYNINDFGENQNTGKYVFYKTDTNTTSSSFTINYVLEKAQNVYVYVDSESVTNGTISIRANGELVVDQNIDEEYIYDVGYQKDGTVISVDIPIKDESPSGYVDCFVYGLNMDKFKQAHSILNDGAINVTQFDETQIKGTVNAKNDCVLYTSIPYDKSWEVFIDGEEVPSGSIIPIGKSLLGIKLSAGQHNIELNYNARGLTAGIIISLITATTLIACYMVINRKKKASVLAENNEVSENNTSQNALQITDSDSENSDN
ncbi:MAG: YfhO family protein [Oscillospiraceae bacterium]